MDEWKWGRGREELKFIKLIKIHKSNFFQSWSKQLVNLYLWWVVPNDLHQTVCLSSKIIANYICCVTSQQQLRSTLGMLSAIKGNASPTRCRPSALWNEESLRTDISIFHLSSKYPSHQDNTMQLRTRLYSNTASAHWVNLPVGGQRPLRGGPMFICR